MKALSPVDGFNNIFLNAFIFLLLLIANLLRIINQIFYQNKIHNIKNLLIDGNKNIGTDYRGFPKLDTNVFNKIGVWDTFFCRLAGFQFFALWTANLEDISSKLALKICFKL